MRKRTSTSLAYVCTYVALRNLFILPMILLKVLKNYYFVRLARLAAAADAQNNHETCNKEKFRALFIQMQLKNFFGPNQMLITCTKL